jgi:hypothetical protein
VSLCLIGLFERVLEVLFGVAGLPARVGLYQAVSSPRLVRSKDGGESIGRLSGDGLSLRCSCSIWLFLGRLVSTTPVRKPSPSAAPS